MQFVKRLIVIPSLMFALMLILTASGSSREALDAADAFTSVGKYMTDVPYVTVGVHNVGKIGLTITNQGSFGTGFIDRGGNVNDPLTGFRAPSCTYPFPGNQQYLFAGAFWIGAVVGRDTLVSTGAEGWIFIRKMWRDTARIHKIYPDQPPPGTLDLDSAAVYFPDDLTPEGELKYYEYEFVLDNILPSQLYYVSVTAFDYGAPGSGLMSLESSPTKNMVAEYAQNQTSKVESEGLSVIVYPNPYRIDGNYRSAGGGFFEGRGQETLPDDRVRAVHFTNLPHKCTIRIFTIDGDLVREIDHDYPPDSPQSMHDIRDIVTRNTQSPVSGIYYYSVESEYGSQIGKMVLIM
ncbi:MAG: hypothetical protein CVT49_08950 [candidate division Zixibacteria bacterium HGW-Zixibacteria-1]|nr:MAG: hypothetical protein CVT49_08950 [candidate division Zixibacteria bacterium HGW-Zixibacteria-1]